MTGVLHIRVQDEINSQLFQAKRWKVEDKVSFPYLGSLEVFSKLVFFLGGGRGRGLGRDSGLPPPHKRFFFKFTL